MRKVLTIGIMALALAGCVTAPNGTKELDRQRICLTTLRITQTVAGIASVLEHNGFAPTEARRIAVAALASGDTVAIICAVLAAKGAPPAFPL